MGNAVKDYLVRTGMTETTADQICEPLSRHADIEAELLRSLEDGAYVADDPVKVEGYTAKDIAELAPFMSYVGAYNFLVTLREDPDQAKEWIAQGFPRK